MDFYHTHATAQTVIQPMSLQTAHDIETSSGLPWLTIRTPYAVPYQAMLIEAQNLHDHYVPHRFKEQNQGWFSLCIHGLSSVHTGPIARPAIPYDWTDICKVCPTTHRFFKDIFGYESYQRVRFMLLKPGGYILPHVDSTIDRLEPINIALNQPDGCDFVMEDCGIVPFKPGSVMLLSLARRHIVWNRSSEDRYHIIVHGKRNATWNETIKASYEDWKRDQVCHLGSNQKNL